METVEKTVECGGRPRELDFINYDQLPSNINSCKETKKEYFRKYMRQYMKQYTQNEDVKEKIREYYQKNKEIIKERSKRAYHLKAGNIIII